MDFELELMTADDVGRAVNLVREAMNDDEAAWADESMRFHFGCADAGLDDGRKYYLAKSDGQVIGLVGLHRYLWGPAENVWLGWFAVRPDCEGQGIGRQLMGKAEAVAAGAGHKRLFVETYQGETFARARRFYEAMGFKVAGNVEQYLPNGHDMIVFGKDLG